MPFQLSALLFIGLCTANLDAAATYPPSTAPRYATYDYIIVSHRLTEDPHGKIPIPEFLAHAHLTPAVYTENYHPIIPAPEHFMQNCTFLVAAGNVVGGSSVVNGMQFDRKADADYDAWEDLGDPGWGFKGLAPYLKKFTTFQAPGEETRRRFGTTYIASAYGDEPVNVSIPSLLYEDYRDVLRTWREDELVEWQEEGYRRPVGVFWTPNTIDNATKERCHPRRVYYDSVRMRPNLHLMSDTQVEEILFSSKKRDIKAIGVRATLRNAPTPFAFHARREVILAASAIFTPQLLILSGNGTADVLEAANFQIT